MRRESGELWDSMQVSNPDAGLFPLEGRKEGWRGKFLTRWCNSKDILQSKCVFQDRQSTMGREHLHILGIHGP